MRGAFTLIETLVVTAVVAILAAILGGVYSGTIRSAKQSACLFNLRQMMVGVNTYLQDYDDWYPQTKGHTTYQPQVDDADGSIEAPDYGSPLVKTHSGVGDCPADPGGVCTSGSATGSYIVNGYFVWGFSSFSVAAPNGTIYIAERRSYAVGTTSPYCENIYHPWFNSSNAHAPENDMDQDLGAIATSRHSNGSNYAFVDSHAGWLQFSSTWSPGHVDLHSPF